MPGLVLARRWSRLKLTTNMEHSAQSMITRINFERSNARGGVELFFLLACFRITICLPMNPDLEAGGSPISCTAGLSAIITILLSTPNGFRTATISRLEFYEV